MRINYIFIALSLLFFVFIGQAEENEYRPGSLIGSWSFDEATDGVVSDASTFGHDLTLSGGATLETGHEGNALSIPSGEYASVEDALLDVNFPCVSTGLPVDSMTVAAWVYLESIDGRQPVAVKEAENQRGFVFSVTDGYVTFQVYNEAEEKYKVVSQGTQLQTGQWYHIAATYEYVADWGSIVTLYLNGEQDFVDNGVPGPIKTSNAPFVVGGYLYHAEGTYNDYYDGGMIDEVFVYTSTLTQEEISNVMDNGTPVGLNLKESLIQSCSLYPNPSSIGANINFTMLKSSHVELSVYDIYGRNVASLLNGNLSAGQHTTYFDAKGMAAGIYVAKLRIGEGVIEKRLVLSK